jgi:hypothetical protein
MRRALAIIALLLASASAGYAGPTKHVGKELTKGVKEELKNPEQPLDLEKAARDISRGLVTGLQQKDKEASAAARVLGRSIAQGFFGELRSQLGEKEVCEGDDRGACADALISRFTYQSARAAARGAADGASPWPSVFVFMGGVVAGLVVSALIALLLGQRRTRRELATLRPVRA